jgi:neurofibromin 1
MFTHTSREQQVEYQKRIKEIIAHLIAITVKQPEMYAAMQRGVWSQISRLDDLIPTFVEVFCEAAMDSGLHTPRFEMVLDTMVSFSSINLRGKLLARLRRVIAKTAQTPAVGQLHENAAWKEIATLVRMNMVLSFTSRLEGLIFLPELLHIILLLAGNGADATRHSIHGTAVNLIHSLCTDQSRDSKPATSTSLAAPGRVSPPASGAPDGLERLRVLLARFSEDEFLLLFGLPAGVANPFDASPDIVRDTPNNAAIEKLATILYDLPELAAPSTDAANSWRARLTSLVTSTAFQYNPIIQSRAFLLLGCLADLTRTMMSGAAELREQDEAPSDNDVQPAFEVDDDLLYQILVSLRGSITEWANAGNDAPIISIVTCLSKVVKILPDRSRYLPQLFWLGISMVQYGHVPLFRAGAELLLATVTSITDRKLPAEAQTDLVTFLLDGRLEFREAACRLDDEAGVDFDTNFSFAMAALLAKGLRHPSTKETTAELLQSMLRFSAMDAHGKALSSDGRIATTQLGFFVALLPTATSPEGFGQLLRLAGVAEETCEAATQARRDGGDGGGLFKHLDALDNKIALLVVTLIAALLQHAESDAERLLLYGFLADSAKDVPAIVSIL